MNHRNKTPQPWEQLDAGISRRKFCAAGLASAAGLLLPSFAAEPQPTVRLKRRWTIYVIQHSHIDIGYTERQEIIAEQHADFIRQAVNLALSPRQKSRDAASKFRFTCEGFWQVEQFLARSTPRERRDFVRAIKTGLMELSACRLHFTELLDQDLLRQSLRPAVEFAKQEGLPPLRLSMECDINGVSWGMADALAEVGVKWLSMNINNHHGAYPFGKPLVPFFWESPSGKRVLAWCGMAYHKANLFGIMGAQTPDGDPGVPGFKIAGTNKTVEVNDISLAERKLLPLLQWLETTDYPFDFLPLMGSGLYTDNSPPGEQYCDIISQWNAKHSPAVHIRSALQSEFFGRLEQHAAELPVHRGEWTDWWSEGVAATPQDTLVFRNAQRSRRMLDMLDPGQKVVSPQRRAAIDDKLMLYAEHTFGYSQTSASTLLTHQIFMRKTKHAIDADVLASSAVYDVLRTKGEGAFTDRRPCTYTILNPLSRPARAVSYLPLDFWEAPTVEAGFQVVDAQNRVYPHQVEGSPRGWNVAVPIDLNPNERRELRLAKTDKKQSPAPAGKDSFQNEWYRVSWSKEKGIETLQDVKTGVQVLDISKGALGSPIYQLFPGGERWAAGTVFPPRKRPQDQVTAGQCRNVRRVVAGPVYERWEFEYEVPGASRYVLVATFFRDLPQIELIARIIKTDVRDPEGMYVLFPFDVAEGMWHLDKPGAIIRPGIDQLPQACTDYYLVQHGAALAGRQCGVAWATLDAPMVQLGELRLWTYSTQIKPTGPMFSWLTNNKWETNFRLTCGGAYDFRYVIKVGADLADRNKAVAEVCDLNYPPLVMRH